MKKLSLNIDELAVESFSTLESEGRRGTVQGYYTMALDACRGTDACSLRTNICGGECNTGGFGYTCGDCVTYDYTCDVDGTTCNYGGGTKDSCPPCAATHDPVRLECYSLAIQC